MQIKDYQFTFSELHDSTLTIITLTYNSSKYIRDCLISLISSCVKTDRLKISHLVIDGNSTDNTIRIIQEISPSSKIFFREPKGIYDGFNYAISLVESPYLMYLHSDDELDKLFLVEMIKKLSLSDKNSTKPSILYGTLSYVEKDSQIIFSQKPPLYFQFMQKYITPFHPNAIYPTILEKQNPYPTDLGLTADRNHVYQIAPKANLIRVPLAIYKFRLSSASSSVRQANSGNTMFSLTQKLFLIYMMLFQTHVLIRIVRKVFYNKSSWKPE